MWGIWTDPLLLWLYSRLPVQQAQTTVMLVASCVSGFQVLRSKDASWKKAEYLGTIPKPITPLTEGSATAVAAVQMGSNSVYMIIDWIGDPRVPGQTAGNRTLFPMPDVTSELDRS
jgi:hypothetical protein